MKNFPTYTPQEEMLNAFRDPMLLEQLPMISFPPELEVRLTPPFGGTLVRFVAYLKGQDTKCVSVYLDASNALGLVDRPYWEIFPNAEGDTSRFGLHDIDEMMTAIITSLNEE